MSKIKILSVFMILLFLCFPVFGDLKVTGIKTEGRYYNIVLNNAFSISDIVLEKNNISMPVHTNKGKVYKQFSILRRDFRNYLSQSLKENKIYDSSDEVNYKINKFKILKNKKTLRAFASVIFNDTLEVECRVMEGENGLWIAWPSSKDNEKWKKLFTFLDKKLKRSVETELIKHYNNFKDEHR